MATENGYHPANGHIVERTSQGLAQMFSLNRRAIQFHYPQLSHPQSRLGVKEGLEDLTLHDLWSFCKGTDPQQRLGGDDSSKGRQKVDFEDGRLPPN